MPRFYRNQFTPWQPDKQVFQVLPMDLSTINAMNNWRTDRIRNSQASIEAYATERVNNLLWMVTNGGVR